jgi:predicted ester cyclase
MVCGPKCGFQVANRVQRPAKRSRRITVQGIFLRLDGSASPLVGPTRKALRDDSPHARRTGGREKVVGAFSSQPVRQGKLAIEPAEVQARGNRRQLVHNRVRARPHDGPDSRLSVQSVQNLWLYPLSSEMFRLLGGPRGSNYNVPDFAQQRDEMLSHYSSGACEEYSHVKLTNPPTDRTSMRLACTGPLSSVETYRDRLLARAKWYSWNDKLCRNECTMRNVEESYSIVAGVAEQFIYDERPMTMSSPVRGRHAFREYLKAVFQMFPDLQIQTTSCDTGSSLAVAESLMSGTYAGNKGLSFGRGRRISARAACVFEVTGGWLVHERLYWDRANFVRQLGLLPALASAATTRAVTFP